jgi:hypothetical protein
MLLLACVAFGELPGHDTKMGGLSLEKKHQHWSYYSKAGSINRNYVQMLSAQSERISWSARLAHTQLRAVWRIGSPIARTNRRNKVRNGMKPPSEYHSLRLFGHTATFLMERNQRPRTKHPHGSCCCCCCAADPVLLVIVFEWCGLR